ncbi:putative signal peptide-containing protein [Cryptosporidium parvum]|nr:putative signal peptide-containing protein [Cryptosporidium sp. 43IA8]
MIFPLLLLLLLLISIDFIQCEDFENNKDKIFEAKAAKIGQSNKYNKIEKASSVSNALENSKESLKKINRTANFQILSLGEVYALREFNELGGVNKLIQRPAPSLQRLTYRSIFGKETSGQLRFICMNPHHLSIGERLIIQSSKFSFSVNRNQFVNARSQLSHISIVQNKHNNDLRRALEGLISNAEKTRINKEESKINELDSKQIKGKKKLVIQEDFVKGVIDSIKQEQGLLKEKKLSSNSVDLVIPPPPNKSPDLDFEDNNLDTNNDLKNSTASSRSLFEHLKIPDIEDNVHTSNCLNGEKTPRKLPPGAELELEEFFARQSKRTSGKNSPRASSGYGNKQLILSKHNRSAKNSNPYKPS